MNKVSPEDAFSLIGKWCEERSILQFVYRDVDTSENKLLWVLINSFTSGGSPSLLMSILADPFPFLEINLTEVEFEFGDAREFIGLVPSDIVESAKRYWESFLKISFSGGTDVLLSELHRRDLVTEFVTGHA